MLLASIDWDRLPRHVAIIMDGNGRWAAQRAHPRIAGHRAGVEAVRASDKTAKNTGMALSVALNYGGRAEIVDACRAAMQGIMREGKSPDQLSEEDIARSLYTSDLPELDLLVRTSGELRISNFLLWQSAYAEIHVTETLWPDFRRAHLLEAVVDYQQRRRRFGGLKLVTEPRAVARG